MTYFAMFLFLDFIRNKNTGFVDWLSFFSWLHPDNTVFSWCIHVSLDTTIFFFWRCIHVSTTLLDLFLFQVEYFVFLLKYCLYNFSKFFIFGCVNCCSIYAAPHSILLEPFRGKLLNSF